MNLSLIGPSGAGKGTHARHLIDRNGLTPLVTGELLRENVARRSAVGFLAEKYIRQGVLVPDDVINATVAEAVWATAPEKDLLFDGFPRTLSQAHYLDELFAEVGRRLDGVIYLDIPHTEILRRLLGRVICADCHTPYHLEFFPPARAGTCDACGGPLSPRAADIPEMIRVRLRAFRRAVEPVLEYYRETGRLVLIDGTGSPGQVTAAIDAALAQIERGELPALSPRDIAHIRVSLRELVTDRPEAAVRTRLDTVLVGGPGSGKGTQAEYLQAQFGLLHVASGNLFRENIRQGTALGVLAKSYIDRGRLVPDDVTEAMVEARIGLPDAGRGFILDGFPRTLPQAEALAEMLAGMGRSLAGVLYIRVSDEEIVRRLSGRLICRVCQTPYHLAFKPPAVAGVCDLDGGELYQRDDDNPQTVRARLQSFHEQTRPILEYYARAGLLVEIDGEGAVDEVRERAAEAFRGMGDGNTRSSGSAG